jgi:hypothetical protein
MRSCAVSLKKVRQSTMFAALAFLASCAKNGAHIDVNSALVVEHPFYGMSHFSIS